MDKKFKGRVKTDIDINDPFFGNLPETSIRNLDDMEIFSNYVKSDMCIEVIRALKFKAAARFIQHPKTLVKLADFMIIDVLGEDEEYVYSTIFDRMIDENRLWDRREDR